MRFRHKVKTTFVIMLVGFAFVSLYRFASLYDDVVTSASYFDRQGEFIGTLNPVFGGRQVWVSYDRLPPRVIEAFLNKEDRFFFWHVGVNPVSLGRALFANIRRNRIVEGGSTITQQLAKNLMMVATGRPRQRTVANKLAETFLALGLEIKHDKHWILENYLNTIYFGNRSYGVGAAARTYFGKKVWELKEEEIRFLANLPQAPNRHANTVGAEDPVPTRDGEITGRHFIEFVSQSEGNTREVRTTLDFALQKSIEENLTAVLAKPVGEDPKLSAAVVVIHVPTGEIRAMVGSRDYHNDEIHGNFNAATALRQPGSALKPFTYFAAFSKGYRPETRVKDEPLSFYTPDNPLSEAYIPQNFDRRFHGDLSIREALGNSLNVPAVSVLNDTGLSYYHDILKKFGFTSFTKPIPHYGLAITLGSAEVSLLELTNAYAALARGGMFRNWTVGANTPLPLQPKAGEITPEASVFAGEITDILSDPEARLKAFGWNEDLLIDDLDVAVKTGTSYDHRDNWTVGYNKDYAVGVWVGHADNTPLNKTTGATGAAPLWHAAMEDILSREDSRRLAGTTPPQQPKLNPRKPDVEVTEDPTQWSLLSPLPNARYRIQSFLPKEHQKIKAEIKLNSPSPVEWQLNGVTLDSTGALAWITPSEGEHELVVSTDDGQKKKIAFFVVNGE